jgi:hypothetical protein
VLYEKTLWKKHFFLRNFLIGGDLFISNQRNRDGKVVDKEGKVVMDRLTKVKK